MSNFPWQGITIRVHPLFWLVILFSAMTGQFFEIITLFILVIIHEMGHVTAATSFGWRMTSMELLPFGGVAKTEEWGTVPAKEEIIVALAGPFQHVFIILMGSLFFVSGIWSKEWTEYFIQINVLMAAFNLLPIYPLDGGRVIHALFSYFFPYRICIKYTLWMSIVLSVVLLVGSFCIPGNVVHVPLCCIALFLLFSNVISLKKIGYQYMRFLLGRKDKGISSSAMIRTMQVRLDDPLWHTIKRWHKEKYHVYEVIDGRGKVVGVIPEEMILATFFRNQHPGCRVRELIS